MKYYNYHLNYHRYPNYHHLLYACFWYFHHAELSMRVKSTSYIIKIKSSIHLNVQMFTGNKNSDNFRLPHILQSATFVSFIVLQSSLFVKKVYVKRYLCSWKVHKWMRKMRKRMMYLTDISASPAIGSVLTESKASNFCSHNCLASKLTAHYIF